MSALSNTLYRILVVDDDSAVLATYRRLLERGGYQVRTEADPLRVFCETYACKVDLLLLDYKMPELDGLSLLAELRRRECDARCILVSAYLNDDVRLQAANLGVDRVIEKPVDIRALRTAVAELLSSPAQPTRAAG